MELFSIRIQRTFQLVSTVQRIGFRVFPCPDECVEEDGTVPVPSGMPPHPELFAAYAIGNQQFRTGCNPRAPSVL